MHIFKKIVCIVFVLLFVDQSHTMMPSKTHFMHNANWLDCLPCYQNVNKSQVLEKLEKYALNQEHNRGGNKARVFESALGYNKENARCLLAQILKQLPVTFAICEKPNEYGYKFRVDMTITGYSDKRDHEETVRTIWILYWKSTSPELVTAYVLEKKRPYVAPRTYFDGKSARYF